MVIFVLLLSLVDGTLTLTLVEMGAREMNPVMHFYLEAGSVLFISVKYLVTAFSLILLVIFSTRPIFGSRLRGFHLIYSIPFVYALLIGHQLSLLSRLMERLPLF